jgi:lipopolysaccharide kinase (Kdo/WaaP) family protein
MRSTLAIGRNRGLFAGPGPDFPHFGLGRRILYIRRDFAPRATAIFAALAELNRGSASGTGNRASGFPFRLDGGPELFARWGRRGGLVRFITPDIYFGASTRPLRELAVANEARLRGIPIAEPLGTMIEAVAPGFYRSAFITRALSGMTLWEFLRADDDAVVRAHIVEMARHAIDTMHDGGLLHADLNLHNLFVTKAGERLIVVILDLDKAQVFSRPVAPSRRRLNFQRLARSARKLDPDRRYLDRKGLAILTVS